MCIRDSTKPANKLSFALQGPHTAAHKIILKALVDAKTVVEVFKIFDEQILTPNDVEEVIFADEAVSYTHLNWGTYSLPFYEIKKNGNALAELKYTPHQLKGWDFTASLGIDRGAMLGKSAGGMLTIRKTEMCIRDRAF